MTTTTEDHDDRESLESAEIWIAERCIDPSTPEVWGEMIVPDTHTTIGRWARMLRSLEAVGAYRVLTRDGRKIALIVATRTEFFYELRDES